MSHSFLLIVGFAWQLVFELAPSILDSGAEPGLASGGIRLLPLC